LVFHHWRGMQGHESIIFSVPGTHCIVPFHRSRKLLLQVHPRVSNCSSIYWSAPTCASRAKVSSSSRWFHWPLGRSSPPCLPRTSIQWSSGVCGMMAHSAFSRDCTSGPPAPTPQGPPMTLMGSHGVPESRWRPHTLQRDTGVTYPMSC
jgi:hypothetical protein